MPLEAQKMRAFSWCPRLVDSHSVASKLRCESQQNVSRDAVLKSDVSRTDEHHATDDAGTARAYGTALCRHCVDRLKLLRRVEFPNRTSIHWGDGAQNAVHSTREEHAGNHADG